MEYNNRVLLKPPKICLLPLFFFLLLSACGDPRSPEEVAADFWKSIQARDLNLLYKNVDRGTVKKYKLDDMPAVGKVYLGDAVIEQDSARVETTVEITDGTPMEIPVKTFLVRKKKYWKVDYDETVQSVTMNNRIARLFSNARQAGDKFMDQFNEIIDEYQKTLPDVQRELRKLENSIKLQIPEIKDRIEKFARELDKALKPPPPPAPAPTPQKPNQPIRI